MNCNLATLVVLFQLLSCRVSLFQINVTYNASSSKLQMLPQKQFRFSWLTWLNSWLSLWLFGFWLTYRSWRTKITTWQWQNMLRASLMWRSFTVTTQCYLKKYPFLFVPDGSSFSPDKQSNYENVESSINSIIPDLISKKQKSPKASINIVIWMETSGWILSSECLKFFH